VALTESSPIAMKFVVTVFGIQFVPLPQFLDNIIKQLKIQATFLGSFVTFLVDIGKFYMLGHSSSALFKSSMLS